MGTNEQSKQPTGIPQGLTMQNYASIRDQQMGGFVQVGAHGTGATIPPVDEQVIAFKLVTPGEGTLEVTAETHPELFRASRVGLGSCGVMAEVTLQCVPLHTLLEETEVLSRAEIKAGHVERLKANKHVRYVLYSILLSRGYSLPFVFFLRRAHARTQAHAAH